MTQATDNPRFQQVKVLGRDRLGRVGSILKVAATETASEIKGASIELEAISRDALGDWIDQQRAAEADGEAAAPTERSWRTLLRDLTTIVRERKSDWLQQLVSRLRQDFSHVDADMEAEYGEGYVRLRRAFYNLSRRFRQPEAETATPVTPVEVLPASSDAESGQ